MVFINETDVILLDINKFATKCDIMVKTLIPNQFMTALLVNKIISWAYLVRVYLYLDSWYIVFKNKPYLIFLIGKWLYLKNSLLSDNNKLVEFVF